CARKEDSMDVW
nr:immunoglobulin heavy chain junction region [Macaca mulatta]